MTNLSALISSLPSLPGLGQAKTEDASAADNFLSLLNIGTEDANAQNPENRKEKKSDEEQAIAAVVNQANPIENERPVRSEERGESREMQRAEKTENTDRAEPEQRADAPRPLGRKLTPKSEQEDAPREAAPVKEAAAVDKVEAPADEKKMSPKQRLKQTLEAISNVLAGILGALNAQPQTAQTTQITQAIAAAQPLLANAIAALTEGALAADSGTAPDAQQVQLAAAVAIAAPKGEVVAQVPVALEVAATVADAAPQVAAIDKALQKLETVLSGLDVSGLEKMQQRLATMEKLAPLATTLQESTQALGEFMETAETLPAANRIMPAEVKKLLDSAIEKLKTFGLESKKEDTSPLPKPQLTAPILEAEAALAEKAAATPDALAKTVKASAEQAVATPTTQPVVNPATVAQPQAQASVVPAQIAPTQDTAKNSGGDSGGNNQQQGAQTQSSAPSALGASAQQASEAHKSNFQQALEKVSTPKLHEQIAFQVKTSLGDGSSKINIKLDPAELGRLEIKIHVGGDGKTGVMITADNKSTLDLLQRDAQGLMRALNDAGLQAESGSMNFNLRGGQQEQGQERPQVAHYQKAQPEEELVDPATVISRSYVVNLSQGLDIKI